METSLIEQHKDEKPEENVKPKGNRFVNILLFIMFMIIAQIPMILGMVTMGFAVSKHNTITGVIGLGLAFIIATGLIGWWVRSYYLRHTYETPKKHKIKPRDVGINLLWFIGTRVVVSAFMLLMLYVYGEESSANDEALMKHLNKIHSLTPEIIIGLIVFFIAVTFVAPYLEEIVFRGIFRETIFSKFSLWLPMLLSSAIFSLNHASTNIIGFIMYMSMGVIPVSYTHLTLPTTPYV